MKWEVSSWLGKVVTFTENWDEIPNVLWVKISYFSDNKPYSFRLIGSDWYAKDGNTFTCWTDPNQSWATNRIGSRIIFNNIIINIPLYFVPNIEAIPGIMLPDELWQSIS